jgi:hypothetical protein
MNTSDNTSEIRRIVARAAELSLRDGWNEETAQAWDDLHAAIEGLDALARPGLAIGRYLYFIAGDGAVTYLIDDISDPLRVHCAWVANADRYEADAVDRSGWCLRSTAEAQLRRRDRR